MKRPWEWTVDETTMEYRPPPESPCIRQIGFLRSGLALAVVKALRVWFSLSSSLKCSTAAFRRCNVELRQRSAPAATLSTRCPHSRRRIELSVHRCELSQSVAPPNEIARDGGRDERSRQSHGEDGDEAGGEGKRNKTRRGGN